MYTDFVWPFALSVLISAALLRYAWPHRAARATRPFMAMTALAGLWSLLSSLQVLAVGLEAKVWLADVRYAAIATLPVAWLAFALAYTERRRWLAPRRLALLLALPLLTLALVATNDLHGLMFSATMPEAAGPVAGVGRLYGPWFWIHAAYSYALIGAGVVLIGLHRHHVPAFFRDQATLMLAGATAPLALNALFLATPSRFAHIDLTPVGFTFSGVLFAWGLFRFHLLDLMPVARAAIVESLPDAVVVLDGQHRVVDLNPAARHLFGEAAEHAVGTPIAALARALDVAWPDEALTEVRSQEVVLAVAGQRRYFDWSMAPLQPGYRGRSGHLVMLLLRDVTERKHFETALIQAKEEAEEMARLKTSFLANMSHEIRTPLTSIIGFADILAAQLDVEQQELLEPISKGGQRLLDTLNSVLDYARLEAGKVQMRAEVLDVADVARETVAFFLPQTRARSLTLYLEDRAQGARACLDRSLLIRVLNNLLENALKFTSEGFVRLSVEADEAHVRLQVRDTGCGISEAFLPHLFDEFRQESTGMARKHEGSGLGLKITRRLVEQMHGTITAESRKGQGSTFTVAFPRVQILPQDAPLYTNGRDAS